MLKNDLERLKLTDINNCTEAVDITHININNNKPQEERAIDFLMLVRNPYIFRVGDITVKVNFKGEKPFSEAIVNAVNYV